MTDDRPSDGGGDSFSGPRRFVDRVGDRFAQFLTAAQDYPAMLTPAEAEGLYRKPFGVLTSEEAAATPPKPYGARSRTYLALAMSQVLTAIDKLALSPGALFIDAGAGSGWVSEILLGLGYRVRAVEPSAAMTDAAKQRIALFERKYHMAVSKNIEFIASSLEDLPPPEADTECADAILFFEAFHHVINERRAAARAFEQLRDGGCIVICGESRWLPGNREQSEAWNHEMDKYGTLESPFSRDYLHHVLERAGFTDIQFFHTVNELIPISDENKTVREVAGNGSAAFMNTVIARRPVPLRPPIAEHRDTTAAMIRIDRVSRPQNGIIKLSVTLENTGSTTWPDTPMTPGWVALALFGQSGAEATAEAGNRERLPRPIRPGECITLHCGFAVAGLTAPFHVRLVADDCFWFKESVAVPLPP